VKEERRERRVPRGKAEKNPGGVKENRKQIEGKKERDLK